MKVITFEDWGIASEGATFDTLAFDDVGGRECRYVGIAIGPDSDDARVLVECDGGTIVTLQSGRVLPLRGRSYKLTKVIGTDGDSPMVRLQVLLFECAEELAAEVARPTTRYESGAVDVDDGGVLEPADPTPVLGSWGVPFVGRRQARITIRNGTLGQPIDYAVIGVVWDTNANAWVETVIAEATAAAMPVSFYVGGTNEGECWDWLRIAIVSNTAAATGTVFIIADVTGEIGVR